MRVEELKKYKFSLGTYNAEHRIFQFTITDTLNSTTALGAQVLSYDVTWVSSTRLSMSNIAFDVNSTLILQL